MKGNENVYPVVLQHGLTHDSWVEVGLTKRELFAAMMMQAYCTTEESVSGEFAADWAVRAADYLITALNKEVQQ